jgi:hypothetical protein
MVPSFKSYAVTDVQGGAMGERPALVYMKPKPLT